MKNTRKLGFFIGSWDAPGAPDPFEWSKGNEKDIKKVRKLPVFLTRDLDRRMIMIYMITCIWRCYS